MAEGQRHEHSDAFQTPGNVSTWRTRRWHIQDEYRLLRSQKYRVVLLDQRGSGKSTPKAKTRENATQHLVQATETLREHLSIVKWHMVFDGSWDSTLALAYSQAHPDVVGSLVLRGVFLGDDDILAAQVFPDKYERLVNFLPPDERRDLYKAYLQRLTAPNGVVRVKAAKAYERYGDCGSELAVDEATLDNFEDEE